MDLIQPAEISGKIMTLLDQAKEEFIIISPYNNITYWRKLLTRIQKAQERGVKITWYTRARVFDDSLERIRSLGIEPIEIENLHCKLYLNESKAVVTSMNLSQVSDNASLDIGYYISERDKYDELKEFVKTYLGFHPENNKKEVTESYRAPDSLFRILELEINKIASNPCSFSKISEDTLMIKDFVYEGMELRFEDKGSYFRVDFRINQPYKLTNTIFSELVNRKQKLLESFPDIAYGTQMKRLKFDLKLDRQYPRNKLGINEFKIIWSDVTTIIKLLELELGNEFYKNLINSYNQQELNRTPPKTVTF